MIAAGRRSKHSRTSWASLSSAIFASFFIQHITAGGAYVDKSMYCAQISDLISALIIYLCGFVLFMKNVMSSVAARREEKAIAKARALAEAKKGGETE